MSLVTAQPQARYKLGLLAALLSGIACVYAMMAPHHVQGLDAGELVAGAFGRFVVHPPGYPLYVWLTYLATHLLPFGTVFYRASLSTVLWATMTLGALALGCRGRILAYVALVVPLALQETFWTYALIPDVFMLNSCVLALLCLAYDRLTLTPLRAVVLAGLFGVGLCNHQTLLFCAPFVVQGIFASTRTKHAWQCLSLSACICVGLYTSLILMHPSAPQSWAPLTDIDALVGHVLRRSYGTFHLARTGARVMPWVHASRFVQMGLEAVPLALILGLFAPLVLWCLPQRRAVLPQRLWWMYASLTLYAVLFFTQVNETDVGVVQRFFLMLFVGYTYLAGHVWSRLRLGLSPWVYGVVAAMSLCVSGLHVAADTATRNLSRNTIVEDYAHNLLTMADRQPPCVLIVDGDAPLGALRYSQQVDHVHPEIFVIALTGLTSFQLSALRGQYPDFILPDLQGRGLRTADLMHKLIMPNEPKYSFVCNATRGLDVSGQEVVFMGLGRRLQKGTGRGVDVDSIAAIVLRSAPADSAPSQTPKQDQVLYAAYAQADYVAGKFSQDAAQKAAHFMRALERVPYCWPAAYELCVLRHAIDDDACRRQAQAMRAKNAPYF